jgi:hypothetical protein
VAPRKLHSLSRAQSQIRATNKSTDFGTGRSSSNSRANQPRETHYWCFAVTLVLGACVADAVVLGADSKTQVYTIDASTGSVVKTASMIDKKLFKLTRVGIATYGSGPPNVRVPKVIADDLQSEWGVSEVIAFLQDRFKGADDMRALVGGLDDHGTPALFDVCMSGASPQQIIPRIGGPLPLVLRGVQNAQLEQRAPGTSVSVITQMLELLTASAGPHVGPPYEFLVISRT